MFEAALANNDERFEGTLVSLQSGQHGDAAVLIVRAGPAGLFAACELLRHGVTPRVVERRPTPHHEARGTALQPATLEFPSSNLGAPTK
jgi:thioredoxin reductase